MKKEKGVLSYFGAAKRVKEQKDFEHMAMWCDPMSYPVRPN